MKIGTQIGLTVGVCLTMTLTILVVVFLVFLGNDIGALSQRFAQLESRKQELKRLQYVAQNLNALRAQTEELRAELELIERKDAFVTAVIAGGPTASFLVEADCESCWRDALVAQLRTKFATAALVDRPDRGSNRFVIRIRR